MLNQSIKFLVGIFVSAGMLCGTALAGGEAEVLHWWTSGGEAKALKVLKDDFAKNGGTWYIVTPDNVEKIVTEHLVKGETVESLRNDRLSTKLD